MTLLDELAPEVDIDAALTAFGRIRDSRRRRHKVTRVGAATLTAAALIGAALFVADHAANPPGRVDVAGPSATAKTPGPPAWPTPQAAIDAYLRRYPHVRPRARISFNADNWILIAEGAPLGFERIGSVWTVSAINFQRDTSGWTQTGAGGGGMLDRCFAPLAGGGFPKTPPPQRPSRLASPDYVYAVTADTRWHIQALLAGRWTTLPTTRGVYFNAHPSPRLWPAPGVGQPIPLRPATADGRVPSCFASRYPNLAK